MAAHKGGLAKAFEDLPLVVKIIFALPGLGFIWGIYRIIKGVENNNVPLILFGVLWILLGWAILWIVDLVTIIMHGKPTILAN